MAEGIKVVEAALAAGAPVESLFIGAEGAGNEAVGRLADEALRRGARVFDLGEGVMERVADTVTPQPVCAVVKAVDVGIDAIAGTPQDRARLVLVCADVRDPGNLGAVLRSATASGADGVVVCAGCVDVYNAKTVRASAGSIFHVPIVRGGTPGEVVGVMTGAGFSVFGTAASGGTDYLETDFSRDVAIVLGNEASGLPGELAEALDGQITIPMAESTESLNVAMTAAVLCFEAARQRRVDRASRANRV